MADFRYEFLFLELSQPLCPARWADFAVSWIESDGGRVTLIGGSRRGSRKAPSDPDALRAAIAASATKFAQTGQGMSPSKAEHDWSKYCGLSDESKVTMARAVDISDQGARLSEWVKGCVQSMASLAPIEYGFAYTGPRASDIFLAWGMSSKRMTDEQTSWFGGDEGLSRWFRAQTWGTSRGYLLSVLPTNVLGPGLEEKLVAAFGNVLPGRVVRAGEASIWSLEGEQQRADAFTRLSAAGLCIASHAHGEASQIKK